LGEGLVWLIGRSVPAGCTPGPIVRMCKQWMDALPYHYLIPISCLFQCYNSAARLHVSGAVPCIWILTLYQHDGDYGGADADAGVLW